MEKLCRICWNTITGKLQLEKQEGMKHQARMFQKMDLVMKNGSLIFNGFC
jgi:hypothetical protein